MDLNENFCREIRTGKLNNENNILDLNNKLYIKNRIDDNNKNQSIGSIKTTEYSSESSELISKYIIDKCKKHHNHNKKNKDGFKENINKNIQINDNILKETNKKKLTKHTKKCAKAQKFVEYNNDYLIKTNTNIIAPKLPLNYNSEFLIDNLTNQDKIGDKDYMKRNDNDTYNKSQEYKKILRIPNDKLSHLIINENLYINKNEKNYNKMCISQRIKHKYLTIIYISPKH